MSDGIYVALSGALSQEVQLETTATNLANASTTGYQRARPVFREILANVTPRHGAMRLSSVQGTALDTSHGATRVTGRALDVSLASGSYLAVATSAGERYTRAGALQIAADGSLRTTSGDAVLGVDKKPIVVSKTDETTIATDGSVMQRGSAVAHLRVVTFARPELITHEGAARLAAGADAGAPTPSTAPIEVGALEESNASVVGSMSEMISASRTFDAFQRAIDAFREADRKFVTDVPSST